MNRMPKLRHDTTRYYAQVYSSSHGKTVGKQDIVKAIFTEDILCEHVKVKLAFGTTVLSLGLKDLRAACVRNELFISRAKGVTGLGPNVQGLGAKVTISNVKDKMGNLVAAVTDLELVDGATALQLIALVQHRGFTLPCLAHSSVLSGQWTSVLRAHEGFNFSLDLRRFDR